MDFKRNIALEVECTNDKNQSLKIIYGILELDIADRWIGLINQNIERENSLRFNYRRILNKANVKKNFKEFRENIKYINAHYDRVLTDIVSIDYLRDNQHILNDLHEEFEIYGDRLEELIQENYFSNPKKSPKYNPVWPGDTHDKVTHECFLRLNEQIHNFEAIFRSWDRPQKMLCTCLVDFMPAGLHEQLKPEDFLLFDPTHEWGWIYLGYNTLGKHWSSTCNDDDIEVVRRKAVRPQQRFAAEFYMDFSIKKDLYQTRIRLYNWWLKNNFSEIIDPELKLRELALGFIPVAKIYGYQLEGKKFTQINDKTNRQKWNEEVWSKFDKIKSVKIIST